MLKQLLLVVGAIVAPLLISYITNRKLPSHFGGSAQKGWENVLDIFQKGFEDGKHHGAAFAVYHNGKLVVDAWGGYMDIVNGRKWETDTVSCAFSTTKPVTAVAVAMLVERGLLKYDDLVSKHWPEFGQHGKDNVTVKMLICHQAGVPYLDQPISIELMRDWRSLGKVLANQKPAWPPGTAYGYHTLTYGFYVDQLVRRVDPQKRSVAQFIDQEITKPNGIDFWVGLPSSEWHRMALGTLPTPVVAALKAFFPPSSWIMGMLHEKITGKQSIFSLSFSNPEFLSLPGDNVLYFNHPERYSVDIPAANGVGTARAFAKLFSLFVEGKFVKSDFIEKYLMQPLNGLDGQTDLSFNFVNPSGWGFWHRKSPKDDYFVLAHEGFGGQLLKVDVKKNLVFVYFRNDYTFARNDLWDQLETAIYKSAK